MRNLDTLSLGGISTHDSFATQRALSAPEPTHLFRREGGCGLDDEITPVCSCGWKGNPVPGWKNYQSTELANQENQHRMALVPVQSLQEGGVL